VVTDAAGVSTSPASGDWSCGLGLRNQGTRERAALKRSKERGKQRQHEGHAEPDQPKKKLLFTPVNSLIPKSLAATVTGSKFIASEKPSV